MLRVSPFTSACVKFDEWCDYIPGVSTITNCVNLILHHCVRPFRDPKKLETSHYFTYLEAKTSKRMAILLIPVLGSALIVMTDFICRREAKKILSEIQQQPQDNSDSTLETNNMLYEQAASYGSPEGLFRMGLVKLKEDPATSRKYLRHAAALGNISAQKELQNFKN